MDPSSRSTVRSFHGHSPAALDAKSRVTVPARWRFPGMDELLALPDGIQPVLRLMPREVLTDMLEKVQASANFGELPPTHADRLGFSGEVLLVGAWKHIEIWRPEEWESYAGKADSLLAVVAQTLGI